MTSCVALHTILYDLPREPDPGESITIAGDEAKHAVRVKRVRVGQAVRLIDGSGRVGLARVVEAARTLVLSLNEVVLEPEPRPDLAVLSAAPKGQRLEKMIDMLTQTGAASWSPLETKLGVVEPGAGKFARLERVVRESSKQCGRARFMRIGASIGIEEALEAAADAGRRIVVADAGGGRLEADRADAVTLIVGPEGGLVEEELEACRRFEASFVGLGPHVLRIETAVVAGASAIMAQG